MVFLETVVLTAFKSQTTSIRVVLEQSTTFLMALRVLTPRGNILPGAPDQHDFIFLLFLNNHTNTCHLCITLLVTGKRKATVLPLKTPTLTLS